MIVLVLGTSTGGVGVHALSLVRALGRAGRPVRVAAARSTLERFDFVAAGATTAAVPIGAAGREIRAVPALRRATADATLVHAHGLRAGTAAGLVHRKPLVVTWHNAVLVNGFSEVLMSLGERFVARTATVNLAASLDLADRIRTLGGRDVRLMPVTPPRLQARLSATEVKDEFGLPAGAPLVVCVGRLHPQKAHDVLIEAAARWTDVDLRPLVVIAGEGPLRDELSTLISTRRAPVRLLGHRGDVADLLAAADVVVLASRWEARPLVVQEAMTLGRAVVATDVGGVAGLVADGAVLVPSGDVDALDGAVRILLADPDRRAALGERARAVAATWPNESDATAAVLDVYAALLDQPH